MHLKPGRGSTTMFRIPQRLVKAGAGLPSAVSTL